MRNFSRKHSEGCIIKVLGTVFSIVHLSLKFCYFAGKREICKESSASVPKRAAHTVWKYCICCLCFYRSKYFFSCSFSSMHCTTSFSMTDCLCLYVVSVFQFSRKVHPQYQKYCLNYSKALSYLDSLKKEEDFQEFMKVILYYYLLCHNLFCSALFVCPELRGREASKTTKLSEISKTWYEAKRTAKKNNGRQ